MTAKRDKDYNKNKSTAGKHIFEIPHLQILRVMLLKFKMFELHSENAVKNIIKQYIKINFFF